MMKHKSFFSLLKAFACGVLLVCSVSMTVPHRVSSGVYGDVNGDKIVDVEDVNAVINIILKLETVAGYPGNGDLNGDCKVDVEDVNEVVNVILRLPYGGSQDQGDWVDLGLPSGTLWATRNIGAALPEDYGDHFAWGEISPKAEYNWDNYKWYSEYYDAEGYLHRGLTKYCTHFTGGLNDFVDNKTELDIADDAAAANWGGDARMPSLDQIEELVNTCSWQLTQLNDVNGQLVTGPNGNTIFLPAAGILQDGMFRDNGYYGAYWSRALYSISQGDVGNLFFDLGNAYLGSNYARCYGLTVRAVRVP